MTTTITGKLQAAHLDTDRNPSLCQVPVTHAFTADELVTLTLEHRRLNPSATTQLSPAMIALWACTVVQERIAALRADQMGTDDSKLVYLFQDRPQR